MRVLIASRKAIAPRNIGATVSGVIAIGSLTRVATTTAMSAASSATVPYGHDGLCAGHACGVHTNEYVLIDDDALPARRGLR